VPTKHSQGTCGHSVLVNSKIYFLLVHHYLYTYSLLSYILMLQGNIATGITNHEVALGRKNYVFDCYLERSLCWTQVVWSL